LSLAKLSLLLWLSVRLNHSSSQARSAVAAVRVVCQAPVLVLSVAVPVVRVRVRLVMVRVVSAELPLTERPRFRLGKVELCPQSTPQPGDFGDSFSKKSGGYH